MLGCRYVLCIEQLVSACPQQMLHSRRQSLVAASGSLGSKIGRGILPPGWSPGGAVIIRDDPRTAHICNLACTIVKACFDTFTAMHWLIPSGRVAGLWSSWRAVYASCYIVLRRGASVAIAVAYSGPSDACVGSHVYTAVCWPDGSVNL